MDKMINADTIEILKNIVTGFLNSPITGSVVGIAGLVITIWTLVTTKSIEKRLPKEKANAIDKMTFRENCVVWLETIRKKKNAVQIAELVSTDVCNDIMQIIIKLQRLDNIISEKDMKIIKEQKEKLQELNASKNIEKREFLSQFVMITAEIESILEKGEYKV